MRTSSSYTLSSRRKRSLLAAGFVVLSLGVVWACLPDDPAWQPRYDYAPDPEASVVDSTTTDTGGDASDDGGDADATDGDASSDAEAGDADPDAADADDGD